MKADTGKNLQLPSWLRLRVRDALCPEWSTLTFHFIKVFCTLVTPLAPRGAVLRVRPTGDRIQIRFFVSPRSDAIEWNILTRLARQLEDLSATFPEPPLILTDADEIEELQDAPNPNRTPTRSGAKSLAPAARSDCRSTKPGLQATDGAGEHRVFHWPDGGSGEMDSKDPEAAAKIKRVMAKLARTGCTRPVATPAENWSEVLEGIEQDSPNFSEVVRQVVRPHIGMLARGIRHRMPPILLVGPPGLGKTHFAKLLATAMGAPRPLLIDLAQETNGATLAGSSVFWSNSAPGALFELLAWGKGGSRAVANPLVVLDEIDKVGTLTYAPQGALYALLERETATNFKDQGLPDLTIDASLVSFVATANELDAVSPVLRSRMWVYSIAPPRPDQHGRVVKSIFRSLIAGVGVPFHESLPRDVLSQTRGLSPREVRLRLDAALAHALAAGERRLTILHWRAAPTFHATRETRIGFL